MRTINDLIDYGDLRNYFICIAYLVTAHWVTELAADLSINNKVTIINIRDEIIRLLRKEIRCFLFIESIVPSLTDVDALINKPTIFLCSRFN